MLATPIRNKMENKREVGTHSMRRNVVQYLFKSGFNRLCNSKVLSANSDLELLVFSFQIASIGINSNICRIQAGDLNVDTASF